MDRLEQAARPLLDYLAAMEAQPASAIGDMDSRWVAYGRVVGGFTLGDLKRLREALAALSRPVEGVKGEPERAPLSCRLKGPVNIEDASTIDAIENRATMLDAQIERLAQFIIAEVPGEPSQSEGAVDTAIRWMRSALSAPPVADEAERKLKVRDHECDFLKRRGDDAIKRAEAAEARLAQAERGQAVTEVRPLDEWHEDYGDAVWWTWQDGQWLGEPSYIGGPNDSDWPGYHTHWSPHPAFPAALKQSAAGEEGKP